jgi:hypothetical protein
MELNQSPLSSVGRQPQSDQREPAAPASAHRNPKLPAANRSLSAVVSRGATEQTGLRTGRVIRARDGYPRITRSCVLTRSLRSAGIETPAITLTAYARHEEDETHVHTTG